jgi:hypothetical protein
MKLETMPLQQKAVGQVQLPTWINEFSGYVVRHRSAIFANNSPTIKMFDMAMMFPRFKICRTSAWSVALASFSIYCRLPNVRFDALQNQATRPSTVRPSCQVRG